MSPLPPLFTYPPLFATLTDPFAQATLLQACGGYVWEHRDMFYVASTPGMPKGSTPVFWQSETELLVAAQKFSLNIAGFPQALLYAVTGKLVLGRLVSPGPLLFISLNDLLPGTVAQFIAAARALMPV